MYNNDFLSQEDYTAIRKSQIQGPNGWLLFIACNSGIDLATKVKKEYEEHLKRKKSDFKEIPLLIKDENGQFITSKFNDGETRPRLPAHVAGANAYVFSNLSSLNTNSDVNDNIHQLLQMMWTLKGQRTHNITAVTPYLPYSRQDKPSFGKREASLSNHLAKIMIASGMNNLITYHLHTEAIKGFYEPHGIVALSGLDLFWDIFKEMKGDKKTVCVSTDAGGAKYNIAYATKLSLDYAIMNKFRPRDQHADVLGIVGSLNGKTTAIITDDETVSAKSAVNAIEVLNQKYGIEQTYLAISHNKIGSEGKDRLINAYKHHGLKEFHVTDSIPQTEEVTSLPFIKVHPLANILACTINRMHYNQSISKIFHR
ncbi:MAG: ribose-phosphate diphosphokinase [Candidatus Woesearchaeota archaeon]